MSGVGALWDCVPRVCGGGGACAGSGMPLGAVPMLLWCGEVSLGGKLHHHHGRVVRWLQQAAVLAVLCCGSCLLSLVGYPEMLETAQWLSG